FIRLLHGNQERLPCQGDAQDSAAGNRARHLMYINRINNSGAPPLPLWERVGVRGSGLSIDLNPSPGSHLRCDVAEASLRRSFPRTAAKAACASPTRGEVKCSKT